MKKLLIIGSGGHAAEVRDYIRHYNNASSADKAIEVVGFIDDDPTTHAHYGFAEPFLGTISDHDVRTDVEYLVGIANVKFRRPIVEKFKEGGATFATLIHPTALISPSCTIGEGCVISHNASVGPKVNIGNFNILNSRCTVGHDTKMGDYNFVSPQVALSGHTSIGDENMFGVNSSTIPGVSIGSNNKIGAGMIIFKPVGDNETVFFRFQEKIIMKGSEEEEGYIAG